MMDGVSTTQFINHQEVPPGGASAEEEEEGKQGDNQDEKNHHHHHHHHHCYCENELPQKEEAEEDDSSSSAQGDPSVEPLQLAAKEYLERNIKYYLQSEFIKSTTGVVDSSQSIPKAGGSSSQSHGHGNNNDDHDDDDDDDDDHNSSSERGKEQLLSLSSRSAISTFKESKSTNLDIVSTGAATIATTLTTTTTTSLAPRQATNGSTKLPKTAAIDFFTRAAKLSKTSFAMDSIGKGSSKSSTLTRNGHNSSSGGGGGFEGNCGTNFSQIVGSLSPCPSLSTNPNSHSVDTPTKNNGTTTLTSTPEHQSKLQSTSSSTTSNYGYLTLGSKKSSLSYGSQRQKSGLCPNPLGKVKVILRINSTKQLPSECKSHMVVDTGKRQLTLQDPNAIKSVEPNSLRPTAAKLFAFDAIVDTKSVDHSQDLSRNSLPDLVQAVLNGNDGVVFSVGKTGTKETMLGTQGLMIYAISWLFNALTHYKRRFAIKCTASKVTNDHIVDLLVKHGSNSTGNPSNGKSILNTDSVLRGLYEMPCINAKRAAHALDLAMRYYGEEEGSSSSSLLFTLHVYQYEITTTSAGKNIVIGGRSRLHLLDIAKSSKNITNTLLAIFNGQKHIPHKESKLTMILKECLTSILVWCTIVVNISDSPESYLDTLTACQFVSRVHRSRLVQSATSRRLRKLSPAKQTESSKDESKKEESESAVNCYTSSSEQSIETVIFCGKSLETPPVMPLMEQTESPKVKMSKVDHHSPAQHSTNTNTTSTPYHSSSSGTQMTPRQKRRHEAGQQGNGGGQKSSSSDPVIQSDEIWVDGPRRHIRKPKKRFKELWVDGPNSSDYGHCCSPASTSNQEYCERQRRIQDWIQEHAKEFWCDYKVPQSSNVNACCSKQGSKRSNNAGCKQTSKCDKQNKSDSSPKVIDACNQTNIAEDEHLFFDGRRTPDELYANCGQYGPLSECNGTDEPGYGYCHGYEVRSEPVAEMPKQLKLEQFLRHLFTATPSSNHKVTSLNSSGRMHHNFLDESEYQTPTGLTGLSKDTSPPSCPTDSKLVLCDSSNYQNSDEIFEYHSSSSSLPRQSSRFTKATAHIFDVTTANVPTHDVYSNYQSISHPHVEVVTGRSKEESNNKRNTISTTTSGHGTTSEGESSSVAQKSNASSRPSRDHPHEILISQPSSSGYESTIHDESDHDSLEMRGDQRGNGNGNGNGGGGGGSSGQPNGANNRTENGAGGSKRRPLAGKKVKMHKSDSNEKCSFFCCKFMDFY